jgi:peroxiredoxin Q/BCP
VTLGSLRGRYILLYFYPEDDTSGCTIEAEALRDLYEELDKEDVEIIGVSADSVVSHAKFKEKYSLPFTLLSDEQAGIIRLYGALGNNNRAERISYLIDPEGVIVSVYADVNPATHASQVLEDVRNIKNNQ